MSNLTEQPAIQNHVGGFLISDEGNFEIASHGSPDSDIFDRWLSGGNLLVSRGELKEMLARPSPKRSNGADGSGFFKSRHQLSGDSRAFRGDF